MKRRKMEKMKGEKETRSSFWLLSGKNSPGLQVGQCNYRRLSQTAFTRSPPSHHSEKAEGIPLAFDSY